MKSIVALVSVKLLRFDQCLLLFAFKYFSRMYFCLLLQYSAVVTSLSCCKVAVCILSSVMQLFDNSLTIFSPCDGRTIHLYAERTIYM